ncbi:aminopeptidase P N-terminal domain-containing protein [Halobacteriovorax sp. HLS]|uniref:aminopeptidase P N-terminal domain-containing protein n=1 Tax=Halobacteriovorax sp. HLS TaxID=2234000 RepID=UPI000FDB88AA|nr:aminopeptidase P N-terminal domain-containing protein [Halobacteriovorax sp. HLS]
MENTNFKNRRYTTLSKLKDGVAIIPAAGYKTRSNDTEFTFRQNSNFKYLTGCNEPDAILVLTPHLEKKDHLFVRPNDRLMEIWSGRRLGPEKSKEVFDMDECYSIDDFQKVLPELLKGHREVFLDLFNETELLMKVRKICMDLDPRGRLKTPTPKAFRHVSSLIEQQRLIKDQNEILKMKKAAHATNRAHRAAMAKAKVGANEAEIFNLMEYVFRQNGAHSSAYESIVAGGVNGTILHYVQNNMQLADGDMLLIDAGSEFDTYASDVTRTFPINGKYTGIQKEVYEIVLEAMKNSFSKCSPGHTLEEVHMESVKSLSQGLRDLKIFKQSIDEIVEKNLYKEFYPHGTSHWLGMDVHDQNPYMDDDFRPITFKEGMLFTVEPGLYFQPDNLDIPSELRGMAVRIEDDILITESSHENLTAMIPKEVKEVEKACEENYEQFL